MHIFPLSCQLIPQAEDFNAIRQFINLIDFQKNLNIPDKRKIFIDAIHDAYFSFIKLQP